VPGAVPFRQEPLSSALIPRMPSRSCCSRRAPG
jgi:hypothetical protein